MPCRLRTESGLNEHLGRHENGTGPLEHSLDFEEVRKQNWFKNSRKELIKLYGLLPKSWLQRVWRNGPLSITN